MPRYFHGEVDIDKYPETYWPKFVIKIWPSHKIGENQNKWYQYRGSVNRQALNGELGDGH